MAIASGGRLPADKLLVVEDDPRTGDLFRTVAESCGYGTCVVFDAPTCKRALEFFDPTVISLDFDAPRIDGQGLLQFLADSSCKAKILIASRFAGKAVDSALRLGSERGLIMPGRILKPVVIESLRATLLHLRVNPPRS